MTLLVSIHDVTPAHAENVTRLWDICSARGLRPALLVVPDWHGAWPLAAHPEFVDWIRTRAREGAEIVLHGERHDEVGLPRGARDRWRAWERTAREGEFLTLGYGAARERIARGLECFRALGLQAAGFIPPAWLAREATFRAAGDTGFAFSEDATSVRVLAGGRRLPSPVVRWSARGAVRAWGSAAVSSARWRLQARAPLVRIALHPPDLDHPATRRSVLAALDRWPRVQRPGRYDDLAA